MATDEEIQAPWGKILTLSEQAHEGGMSLLRVRIREGRRFTDLDLDPATAAHLGRALLNWAEKNNG